MKALLIAFSILFSINSLAQSFIPSDFSATPLPVIDSKEWVKLNSLPGFKVSNRNGALQIDVAHDSPQTQLALSDGELIGVDRGEWGGHLLFQSNVSAKKKMLLKSGNIKFIYKNLGRIYFIESLAHMDRNCGTLYELKRQGQKFRYSKLLSFNDAPEAIQLYHSKIYLAGFSSFSILDRSNETTVFKNMFWRALYPNSVAVMSKNEVYVGIRGGYVKLDLSKGTCVFYRVKETLSYNL